MKTISYVLACCLLVSLKAQAESSPVDPEFFLNQNIYFVNAQGEISEADSFLRARLSAIDMGQREILVQECQVKGSAAWFYPNDFSDSNDIYVLDGNTYVYDPKAKEIGQTALNIASIPFRPILLAYGGLVFGVISVSDAIDSFPHLGVGLSTFGQSIPAIWDMVTEPIDVVTPAHDVQLQPRVGWVHGRSDNGYVNRFYIHNDDTSITQFIREHLRSDDGCRAYTFGNERRRAQAAGKVSHTL